jgi:hypothetical protein
VNRRKKDEEAGHVIGHRLSPATARALTPPLGSVGRLDDRLLAVVPWLQLGGAVSSLVLLALWSAVHSQLGKPLTSGESAGFVWVKLHASSLLWAGFAHLCLGSCLQSLAFQWAAAHQPRRLRLFVGLEVVAVVIVVVALLRDWTAALALGHTLLQAALLLQVLVTLRAAASPPPGSVELLDLSATGHGWFLASVVVLAAAPALFDPSSRHVQDYVQLDSGLERLLTRVLPAVLSGATALWFGTVTLVIVAGGKALRRRRPPSPHGLFGFVPFLSLSAFYAGVFVALLFSAMAWELKGLRLTTAVVPLFLVLSGSGGVIGGAAFRRLTLSAPRRPDRSLVGMLALSAGSVLVFPLTCWLTRTRGSRVSWWLVVGSSLLATLALQYYVLLGDLFNPWFTVFSYLKGALLKATAVVAAGIVALAAAELRQTRAARPARATTWIGVALLCLAAFLPFALLERVREVKSAILGFGELTMVDATYARAFAHFLRLARWVRLGQHPTPDGATQAWPRPWRLEKTLASHLPPDFNLILIVVDALRGDASRSAGYHRDLTPFLDAWGREDAVAFRRAYSQGGGTYAAFPFLVGGRSRFGYYGPDLYHDNLYFAIARAEGIRRFLIVQDWPRALFPPDVEVIGLCTARARPDGQSLPGGDVFAWAEEAIDTLAPGERFFAVLPLLDVHNDLWKKREGLDFGDRPRDLYDNNVSYVDRAFRGFVTWLKQRGLYDRTVIVFTSDHGEQFWEHGASLHGHTVYEEDIRVPVILRVPGITGGLEDVPVVAADLAPTIAELAGYVVDPPYDDPRMGISLVPLLRGSERARYVARDVIGMASFKRRYFLLRDWRWKLVYWADFDVLELFDIAADPGERRNLLQERPALAAELERELLEYVARVSGAVYRPLLSEPRDLARGSRDGRTSRSLGPNLPRRTST